MCYKTRIARCKLKNIEHVQNVDLWSDKLKTEIDILLTLFCSSKALLKMLTCVTPLSPGE